MIEYLKKVYYKFSRPNKYTKILGVKFGLNCNFSSESFFIKIGNNFYSSQNVSFIAHDGSVNVLRNMYEKYKNIDLFSPIIIGNNVFIGYGTVILPGTHIGDNVIIGAGSIVRERLQSNSVYAGIPVQYICSIKKYANKNEEKFIYTKQLPQEEKKKFIDNWLINNYSEFNVG